MGDLQENAQRLLANLLGLDPSEREAYLEEIGRASPSDRTRVEQLLRDDQQTLNSLNRPHLDPDLTPTRMPAASSTEGVGTPSQTYVPQFRPGDVIANRFVVIRFIARGGMGEVYEAEDRQLRGVHVALKTILSHFATDPMMHERFKREVLNAREIAHPHVCPVYDLFEWDRTDGRLLFLTMKLLQGETLLERLARGGRLSQAEVTAITRQVGSGLAAAHAAGVLHRDIKSANIMLNGSGESVYAWITDFGLARAIEQESTALTVNGVAGTPGYVAPELLYGEPPSKASDVFAFGVVVYEMLTGKMPRGVITEAHCRKELQSAEITGPWRRMVESCLKPEPGERCQNIESALRMVPGLAGSTGTRVASRTSTTPPKAMSRRRVLGLTGAAAALAAGGGAWLERDWLVNIFHPLPARRFVALMAWPVNDSSAMVTTLLDEIGARLVRAESSIGDFVVFGSHDLSYGHELVQTPADAAKVLGATLVLAGSLRPVQGAYDFELQLVEVATSTKLRHQVLRFSTQELSSIERKAAEIATRMLGLPRQEKPVQESDELSKLSPDALQIFSKAREAAEKPNGTGLDAAIGLYQKAVDLNPQFSLGYAELAIAYIKQYLRNGERANVDLARNNSALALRYNPDSAKALLSGALVHLYSGESAAALATFSKALAADPENPQILLYQAQTYRDLNRYDVAKRVYERITSERPNYWPGYNELGFMLSREGDHAAAAEEFKKAKAVAPQAAVPQSNLGSEYLFLGRYKEAKDECTASIEKSPTDNAYQALGDLAFMNKDYRLARSLYQKAADLNPHNHDNWRDIGDCEAMLGNGWAVKQNDLKAAQALSEEIPKHSGSASEWATLAFYFAKVGKREDAESGLRKAGAPAALDLNAQLMVIQAIDLLGRKREALDLLLRAMDKGLAPIQVDFALDLKNLQNEPEYLSRVAKFKARGSVPIT